VALKEAGEGQHVFRAGARARDGARGDQARHDRGGGRAEAAPVRDPVHAAQREAGRLRQVQVVERNPQRPDDQVLLPRAHDVAGAFTGHLDVQPGAGDAHLDLIVQA
jgi:hypothetical protein